MGNKNFWLFGNNPKAKGVWDKDNDITTWDDTEIEFNDGSSIKFLDDDDEIQSFYVTEKEYEELKTGIKSIMEKLK